MSKAKALSKLVKQVSKSRAVKRFFHGVDDPAVADDILRTGLKPGSSVARGTGWAEDYPVRLELEYGQPVKSVSHHPDHYLTTDSSARIKKITVDRELLPRSSSELLSEIRSAEDAGEKMIEAFEKSTGLKENDPRFYDELINTGQFKSWDKRITRLYNEQDEIRAYEKSKGWPTLEERMEKLKKTAKELGIPVEILSMILAISSSRKQSEDKTDN